MCGIAGVHIKDDKFFENNERFMPFLENFVNELALGIESRGRHATGIAAVSRNGKKVQVEKDKKRATEFLSTRKDLPKDVRTVLVHTRFATQGPPEVNVNNHPVNYGGVWLTHNGVINNDDNVFKDLELDRFAEVDTEAIAAIVHKYGWTGLKEGLPKLHGGYAFAAVDVLNEPGRLILVKGPTYPLVLHENKQFVVWASDSATIKRAWKNVLSAEGADKIDLKWLQDGDIAWVEGDDVSVEKNAFESYTYGWDHQGHYGGGTCDSDGWYNWDEGDYEEPAWETTLKTKGSRYTKGKTSVVLDLSRPVAAKRAAGNGIAMTYDERQLGPNNGKWTRCPHCTDMIRDSDMRDSALWDKICLDCNWFAINHRFTNTKAKIDDDEREDLETWAETDWEVHKYAIESTAYETGLMPAAVQYLLFAAPNEYLKKNKKIGALKKEVEEIFFEYEKNGWDGIFQKDEEEEQKKEEKKEPAMVQHDFGQGNKSFHIDSEAGRKACKHCTPQAAAEEDEDEDAEGEDQEQEALEHLVDIDLDKNDWRFAQCEWITCTKAGQVTHNGRRYCVTHLAEHAERAKREQERKAAAEKDQKKCGYKNCRKKAQNFMGTAFRFCDTHFNKCSISKCRGKPRATLNTNARLCHLHARSLKGVYFDNDEDALKRAVHVTLH